MCALRHIINYVKRYCICRGQAVKSCIHKSKELPARRRRGGEGEEGCWNEDREQLAISSMSGVSAGATKSAGGDGQSAPVGHNDEESHLTLHARDSALKMAWNGECAGAQTRRECTTRWREGKRRRREAEDSRQGLKEWTAPSRYREGEASQACESSKNHSLERPLVPVVAGSGAAKTQTGQCIS